MDGPESTKKADVSDAETIKKLKSILLKEKKIGKENTKTIQDLKEAIEKKNTENQQLIDQITRLSSNINIENENHNYKLQYDELKKSTDNSLLECMRLIANLVGNQKYEVSFALSKPEDVNDRFCNVFRFLEETVKFYESNSVLKDGFDILTNKNNDLEEKILSQTSQIRQLEEIIEESRNISRELENERDQLQNDLVDLRQRSEEKESLLGDECREIRREYDNFKEDSENIINKLRNEINDLHNEIRNNTNKSPTSIHNENIQNIYPEENSQIKDELNSYVSIIDGIKEKLSMNKNCENPDIVNEISEMQEKSEAMCKNYETLKDELRNIVSNLQLISDIDNLNDFAKEFERLVALKNALEKKLLVETNDSEEIITKFQKLLNDNLCLTNSLSLLNIEDIDDEKIKQIRTKIEIYEELKKIFDENNIDLHSRQFDTLFQNSMNNSQLKEILLKFDNCNNLEDLSIKVDELLDSYNSKFDVTHEVTYKSLIDEIRKECNISNDTNDETVISQLLTNHLQFKERIDNLNMTSDYLMNKIGDMFVRISQIENHEHVSEESFKELLAKYTNLQEKSNTDREKFVAEQENLRKQLEIAQKSMNKNDLMNLEMAEIDKTLHNLHEQLKEKSTKITQLQTDFTQSLDKIKKLESNNSYLETRNTKMKQLLVKNKKELSDKSVENENFQTELSNQQLEIEKLTQELENVKFEFSNIVKGKETAVSKLKDQKLKFDTLLKTKETKLNMVLSELESKKNALEILQTEFEAYKVKAQVVFNNSQTNQTKLNFSNFQSSKKSHDDTITDKIQNPDESTKSKLRISELETEIDELKLEILSNEDRIVSLTEESDMYRTDSERWADKYKTIFKEKSELNSKYNQLFQSTKNSNQESKEKVSSSNKAIGSTSRELTIQYQNEKQKIIQQYETKLNNCKSEYRENLNRYESRIYELESHNTQLEAEKLDFQEQVQLLEAKLAVQLPLSFSNTTSSDLNQKIAKWPGPLLVERQQGEGMDASQIDQSDVSKTGGFNTLAISSGGHIISPRLLNNTNKSKKTNPYNNGLVPLEELLSQKPDEHSDHESSHTLSSISKKVHYQVEDYGITTTNMHQGSGSKEKDRITELERTAIEYKSKLEILTASLEDSESTVENLNKQTELLKSEIRRLENNEEREKTLRDKQSYEYLKNVLLKFLTFKSSTSSLHITLQERDQLIPVLSTILQLTASEKQVLQDFVKYTSSLSSTSINIIDHSDNTSTNGGGGWSNYFTWSN